MKLFFRSLWVLTLMTGATTSPATAPGRYDGKYCEGVGDVEYLRLIDESFACFHPNPVVPNLTMLYRPDWDTLEEGANWGGWWANNSHGFCYCLPPFLSEPWSSIVERTNKLWYDGQGDGKTDDYTGTLTAHPQWKDVYSKVPRMAPEGVLPEYATPGGIRGCQHIVGEGNVTHADWALTSTAAEIMLQAELLLVKRDKATIQNYLPLMEKASDFLESRRDPKNGLLLAGPCRHDAGRRLHRLSQVGRDLGPSLPFYSRSRLLRGVGSNDRALSTHWRRGKTEGV